MSRFERRNVGVLAELPEFVQGGAPLPAMNLMPPMAEAMAEEPTRAAPQAQGPMTDTQRAEMAAAELIAAAEKNRQQAGTPLNRVLSAVGGVVGAPLNFLGAALEGGDMRQVTAPFRPQQTANEQFQQRVLGIQDSLAKIRENAAQTQASLASAMNSGLKSRTDIADGFNASISNLAVNASRAASVGGNPQQVWANGLANLSRNPVYGAMVQEMGFDQTPWSPTLAAELATSEKGAARIDKAMEPRVVPLTPGGTGVVFPDQYSTKPSGFFQQGTGFMPLNGEAPPPDGAAPTAEDPLVAEARRRGLIK